MKNVKAKSTIRIKKNLIFLILIFFIILQFGILYYLKTYNHPTSASISSEDNLVTYASRIVALCKEATYRPGCYDKEIPKLMEHISMEEAFEVTKMVQKNDTSYAYCHVLGHELSAREVSKDPNNWKNVLSRCPSGTCSNGCIHGGFQERFRKEVFTTEKEIEAVKPDLKTICERREGWNPTGLEQASCYHALGHLTMYITNAEIQKATSLCDEVAIKEDGRNYSQFCYDGAFMQIFQPLEPEDYALIKGKEVERDGVKTFCSQFEEEKKGSCWSESWPLFIEEIKQPQGLVTFCSNIEPQLQGRCYNAMFYVLTAQFQFDTQRITDYCSALPDDLKGGCFANAASRFIETDYGNIEKAVNICKASSNYKVDEDCYNELLKYSTYNYHPGSKEFNDVCSALPKPWDERCL